LLTYTALTAGIKEQPDLIAKFEERIPIGRGAVLADIAGAIAFLTSDDERFVGRQPAGRWWADRLEWPTTIVLS
jgi:NAD(P)-dependent dehydrogenase (short-subunit alcohol dehydrogenase family)